MSKRIRVSLACALAALAAAPAAEAHNLSQGRAQSAATAALESGFRAADFPPVAYCPPRAGHVHRIRCSFEFLRGFELCDGSVAVRLKSARSRRLRVKIRKGYCGVPGGPRRRY